MSLLPARHRERFFERLYRRHVGDVYRYALVVLRDPHAAESVTQATFVTALRAHQRGERPRRPFIWLLGIAHDVCARRSPGEDVLPDAWEEDVAPSPADIRRALGRLGLDERSVLMMREVECRSYAEIAEVLELEDAEVETLVFRARQALREQLEGSLTCHQAERAVSRELDGRLPRAERKLLRAHLRSCPHCVDYERMHRGNRAALRSFKAAPVPDGLRRRRRRSRLALLARATAGIATAPPGR
jgi:RNA polymerase sigma-70 factor, ECF subfamily